MGAFTGAFPFILTIAEGALLEGPAAAELVLVYRGLVVVDELGPGIFGVGLKAGFAFSGGAILEVGFLTSGSFRFNAGSSS